MANELMFLLIDGILDVEFPNVNIFFGQLSPQISTVPTETWGARFKDELSPAAEDTELRRYR